MFKIVLIILALISLVGTTTTTHYAFANGYMGGPAMGPEDSGSSSGGSSSQGPSDTTTSAGGSGGTSDSGGGAGPATSLGQTALAGIRAGFGQWSHHTGTGTEDWTVADWHRHHQLSS